MDLVAGSFWGRNPHDELTWLRANDPVHFDEVNGVWGITRYDHVREISKDPATFSSAGGIRPETGPIAMMIDMDDPAHLARRKLVNKGFTPQRVRDLEPKIGGIVDRLLDRVEEAGSCDLVWDVAAWLPLVLIGDALGFEEEDHPTLLEWSDDLMRGLGTDDLELLERTTNAFLGYQAYIAKVVADRRDQARDDLISILVHAEVDGDRLDDDELLHETLLLLIGGDETSRHVMTGGAFQLLSDREQWDALRADRSLLPGAIEEMLRWVTPIKNMCRIATRDVDFHGKTIGEGQKLMLLYPSANRDEDQFPEPFRFDIRRSPNEHVAFGFGPHFCLGASLARLELTVLFDRLLDRVARPPARQRRRAGLPGCQLRERLRVDAGRVQGGLAGAGSTVPVTSPRLTYVAPPSRSPAQPRSVTRSPSCRNVRVVPSGSVIGRVPPIVRSIRLPSIRTSGPTPCPTRPGRPVRHDAPLTVTWASCCAGVQYMSANPVRDTTGRDASRAHGGALEQHLEVQVEPPRLDRLAGSRRRVDLHRRRQPERAGAPRALTSHGDIEVAKLLPRNGPSGWYSKAWMSRADQSFTRQKPKT